VYTGSGLGQMRGIIPRAMEQVGRYKAALEGQGWQYTMHVSFLEIYNEQIRDLLRDRPSSSNNSSEYDGKHEIKRDIRGVTTVTDMSLLPVDPNDSAEVERILELAASHRSVGSTAMNSRSSRSHSVFTLHLTGTNAGAGSALKGALHLVDLAGSERVGRSGVTGDQLKETVSINKSLSSLVDVFTALANKNSHVPFRNSKLTYLLQPALSGEGKTGMIVNVSPTEQSYGESLCSLRFAAQVNQCELGKAKRSIKSIGSSSDDSSSGSSNSGSSLTAPTASSSSRPPTSRKASGASR
jgi:kinesin family member C1